MTILAMLDLVCRDAAWRSPELTTALLLMKATALLLAAAAIALLMRRTTAGARHQVWLVALLALLALPALALWSPLKLKVLPAVTVAANTTQLPSGITIDRQSRAKTEVGAPLQQAVNPAIENTTASALDFTTLALGGWLAVALLLMAWLVRGWYQVRRIVRRAQPLAAPEWQGPLYEIADRLGLEHAPRLLRSEDVHMPFACGLLRSTIVLPAESDDWSAEQRTAVLIHELGHVRRRDLVGHTLGRVACTIYWFHPLVWTAARRLRDESERACDDLALAFGARPSEYAEHLLSIVTSVRDHATPSIALAMAHRKEFEGRMLAILDPQLPRVTPSRWRTAPVMVILAAGSLALGAAAPVRRDPVQAPVTAVVPPAPSARPAPSTAPLPAADPKPVALPQQVDTHVNVRTSTLVNTRVVNSLVRRVEKDLLGGAVPTGKEADDRTEMLAKLLRTDSSASVRRIAAWGLEKFAASKVATEALSAALAGDSEERVREMAAWAMIEGDTPGVEAALESAVQRDKSPRVRETAVWGLGTHYRNGTAAVIGRLLESDGSAHVRATAAWALGQMNLTTAPKGLLVALSDSNDDVRYKAAWALSQIGDRAALPVLRKALEHETHDGALRAELRGLIASGVEPTDLAPLVSSKYPAVRAAAARALAGKISIDPWPWPWPRPIPTP